MSRKDYVDFSKLTTNDFPYLKRLDREQEDMVVKLYKKKRVIVDSVTGSGKTSILTQALKVLLDKGHVNSIYYVVFPVQEDSLGYLPGPLNEKIKEYARPFIDALLTAGVNPHELDINTICDEESNSPYKVVPHTFFRGRTFENIGVLVDEAQNGTKDDLKKTFTRFGDSCFLSVAGHIGQADIKNSGFESYINHFRKGKDSGEFHDISFATLTHNYRGKFSAYSDTIE